MKNCALSECLKGGAGLIFLLFPLFCLPALSLGTAKVSVSEFLAVNDTGLKDCLDKRSDWVEICNEGTEAVNLEGFGLSDSKKKPFAFTFPPTNLCAGARLLVRCSGSRRTVAGEELHAPFKLSSDGEFLGLFAPDGESLSQFSPYPRQHADISYGLGCNGKEGYLETMTPGSPNDTAYARVLSTPVISSASGLYREAIGVTIESQETDAEIVYTTDGSEPGPDNGEPYAGQLPIEKVTVLMARAIGRDARPSAIAGRTYVIYPAMKSQLEGEAPAPGWPAGNVNGQKIDYGLDKAVLEDQAYSPLLWRGLNQIPVISMCFRLEDFFGASSGIYVNAEKSGDAWERKCRLEMLPFKNEKGFLLACGVSIKGNTSRKPKYPKHSFHLAFKTKYGPGKLDYPLFKDGSVTKFDNLDLRAVFAGSWAGWGSPDDLQTRDATVFDLHQGSSRLAKRTRPCHLFLNGVYWGIYWLEERINENFAISHMGGAKGDYDIIKAGLTASSGDIAAWLKLREIIMNGDFSQDKEYYGLLGCDEKGERVPSMPVYVDIFSVADITALYNFTAFVDGPPNNFFAIRKRDGSQGFQYFAHDCELAIKREYELVDLTTNRAFFHPFSPVVHQHLMENRHYRDFFIERIGSLYFNDGPLCPEKAAKTFQARADEICDAVIWESARWGNAMKSPSFTRDGNWKPEIRHIVEDFFQLRHNLTLQQYRTRGWYPGHNPPRVTPPGGKIAYDQRIAIAGELGVVYTIDGSDPISSASAREYREPISPPNHNFVLKCAYRGGEHAMTVTLPFTINEVPEGGLAPLMLLAFLAGLGNSRRRD